MADESTAAANPSAPKLVKVKVTAPVNLAGREHSEETPSRFFPGETVTIDEGTAKASPWAFKIIG